MYQESHETKQSCDVYPVAPVKHRLEISLQPAPYKWAEEASGPESSFQVKNDAADNILSCKSFQAALLPVFTAQRKTEPGVGFIGTANKQGKFKNNKSMIFLFLKKLK